MKDTVFIKDLPVVQKYMSTEFIDAMEEFIPKWLDSLLPYYQEAKEQGAEMFELSYYLPMGAPAELYEKNGVGYYKHQVGNTFTAIGFDSTYPNNKRDVNLMSSFEAVYPEIWKANKDNFWFCSHIFRKPFNMKAPNDVLLNRVNEYFRSLTSDDQVWISFGGRTRICLTDSAKGFVNWYCMLD